MGRLEAHVEAIVGPLRASERRKDRIRDELLDHLEAARGESLDDDAAIERLGSVDALRADIQDSVPTLERWLNAPVRIVAPIDALFVFDSIRDRTPLRYAIRRTAIMTSLLAIVVAVTLAALSFWVPPPSGKASAILRVACVFGLLAISTFMTFYVLEKTGMRSRLDLRDSCSARVQMLYLALFAGLYTGPFLVGVEILFRDANGASLLSWLGSWSATGAGSVLGALALGTWLAIREADKAKKRFARWGTAPGAQA